MLSTEGGKFLARAVEPLAVVVVSRVLQSQLAGRIQLTKIGVTYLAQLPLLVTTWSNEASIKSGLACERLDVNLLVNCTTAN